MVVSTNDIPIGSPNQGESNFGISAVDVLMMDQDIAPSPPSLPNSWAKMVKVDSTNGSDTSDMEEDDDSVRYDLGHSLLLSRSAVNTAENAASILGGHSNSSRPDLTLPQLYINYCKNARLYMISPYYSASITGCVDSTIIVGAVYGVLIMNGCERVKVTAACRKAIIINCLECEINLATLSHSIVMGDSRSLTFGPHNVAYRNLHHHLRMAELTELVSKTTNPTTAMFDSNQGSLLNDEPMLSSNARGNNAMANNCWAQVCDVNACLELTTPKLFPTSMERVIPRQSRFTAPLVSTAQFLAPERYKYITVPIKGENVAFDRAAIPISSAYLEQLRIERERIEDTKTKLLSLVEPNMQPSPHMMMTADNPNEGKQDDSLSKLLASSALSKKFMEWLIATENIQEVLDLIRIDSERPTSAAAAMH